MYALYWFCQEKEGIQCFTRVCQRMCTYCSLAWSCVTSSCAQSYSHRTCDGQGEIQEVKCYTHTMVTWLLFHIHTINLIYAVGGLLLLAVSLGLCMDYIWNQQRVYQRLVAPYVWWIIAVTSIGGVATTLLYSEVFGFVPCSLCWLQRVALYSQALVVVAAWYKRDTVFFPVYGIILSSFGLCVAVYQYIYQALPAEVLESGALPCLADGSADCSKTVMEVFGFVTFPFLSAVIFMFFIILYLQLKKAGRRAQ